jgi:hypothetical protein
MRAPHFPADGESEAVQFGQDGKDGLIGRVVADEHEAVRGEWC